MTLSDQLDLVDEMQWEDVVEFITLEEAGLENADTDTVPSALRGYFEDEDGGVESSRNCVDCFDTIEDAEW